jgi:transketolase
VSKSIEQLAADTIRVLSMDAVQRANSGHPGMPMGMADLAVVLWSQFLTVDPDDPTWVDRDRFVLSNGHGSMLLYSALHLAGFPLTMDDIRNFRQWGSPTAGHPEIEPELGIEMTTGPLGQGFATGVGMALAETHLRAKFGAGLINHHTYGFVSDGDLMEGVASETASLAGHLALGRLIYLYDDNDISLVGPTSLAFSEDVPQRFDAYGWHTQTIDGHDQSAISEAIAAAVAEADRPSLISCKTHIGFGSPNKQDSAGAHGSPLGAEEIELTRQALGWDLEPFEVPSEVYDFFNRAMDRGRRARAEWIGRFEAEVANDAAAQAAWVDHFEPGPVAVSVPVYEPGTKVATRQISGAVIQELAAMRPDMIGGSADLASSTNTLIADSTDFSASDRTGRNIRFGVREFGMGAMVNGLTIHGGLRGYGATFLQFSDYMRGAVRLGALMGTPAVWVWTHDSIFLGEDGPTHQPVEHIAALRAIPNLRVVRPATPAEVAGAWELAMNRTDGPTALILTRQGLPVPADESRVDVGRGAYVIRDGDAAVVVATGSEVHTTLAAADLLAAEGVSLRVVSMPCVGAFLEQSAAYRAETLGDGLPVASVEAGVTFGWSAITGTDGLNVGVDRFGASAPAGVLAEQYGLTPGAVAESIRRWLTSGE